MKIAVISDWFAEKMGYSENLLPSALARQGAEVHLITSTMQPAFKNYKEIYEPFLGPMIQPAGIKQLNGFTLHRLPHGRSDHGVVIAGLHQRLAELCPDVVQTFLIRSYSTYQTAWSKVRLGFPLFLEEHTHASVFKYPVGIKMTVRSLLYRNITGKILGALTEKCYPIAPDCAEIAIKYFGFPANKIEICSLGVDTERFSPPITSTAVENRRALRAKLGFAETDLVCLYSGRFSPDKNPLCLAQAIDLLQDRDTRFKGLFIGSGSETELAAIAGCRGCVTHPFVNWLELPDFYRACDIGVWPKQESTSQLDAAATGLPLVISDRVQARERVDGNGLTYVENDHKDLARQLLQLSDSELRSKMSEHGVQKVRADFSWDTIAQQRIRDYTAAIRRRTRGS